jgi:hypothetical protein
MTSEEEAAIKSHLLKAIGETSALSYFLAVFGEALRAKGIFSREDLGVIFDTAMDAMPDGVKADGARVIENLRPWKTGRSDPA